MTLPIRIANNIDFDKSWTYNLCALYSRHNISFTHFCKIDEYKFAFIQQGYRMDVSPAADCCYCESSKLCIMFIFTCILLLRNPILRHALSCRP